MADTFGARVRAHRERRGISLETIAQQTKIKASLLDGLERGDISQWPSGIFRRAYVRAYAEAIGLNADEIAREFTALHPEPVEALPAPPPQPTRVQRLIGSAFGSLSRWRGKDTEAETESPRVAGLQTPAAQSAPRPPSAPSAPTRASAADPPRGAPPAPAPSVRAPETPPDLLAAARLCTEVGRVKSSSELVPLLRDVAKLLGARGLIVWTWNGAARELRPAIIHGYSDKVRARLRPVTPDADNATAEAFRLLETRAVASRDTGRNALAVPLLSAAGCAGVLAIELPRERAELPVVQAIATFLAAVLAQLIGGADSAERSPEGADRPPTRAERRAGRRARRAERGERSA